jgi:hypothetical protein
MDIETPTKDTGAPISVPLLLMEQFMRQEEVKFFMLLIPMER